MIHLSDMSQEELAIWAIVAIGVLVVIVAIWRGGRAGEPRAEGNNPE